MNRQAAQEILDFLNSIEGAGYGGMAVFEIARQHAKVAAEPLSSPSRRDDWHYDSQGYCDNPGRGY
jgi:hypothetical protein